MRPLFARISKACQRWKLSRFLYSISTMEPICSLKYTPCNLSMVLGASLLLKTYFILRLGQLLVRIFFTSFIASLILISGETVNVKLAVGIAVPLGVVLILAVVVGIAYMRKQREKAVEALKQAEEGEKRNYKIDEKALTVGHLIGAGGFGYVYKGEYRGAEVAVKKLKVQKMDKLQLDQFAKESSTMIGLRHPSIPYFSNDCILS